MQRFIAHSPCASLLCMCMSTETPVLELSLSVKERVQGPDWTSVHYVAGLACVSLKTIMFAECLLTEIRFVAYNSTDETLIDKRKGLIFA